jgi:cell division protein FtsW
VSRPARAGVRRERHAASVPLLIAAVSLVAFGVVMVYSASSVQAYVSREDASSYGVQQALWAAIGLSAMVVLSRLDFRILRRFALPGFLAAMVLLAIVLVPGVGTEVNGSRRWLAVPLVGGFQPAEIAKLAVVVYLAHWLDRRGKAARTFWNGLVPFSILVLPGFVLIAAEPDLGTAGVYVISAFAVFFVAGANLVYVGAIGAAVAAGVAWVVARTPYQLSRVQAFFDPWSDPMGEGYNTLQALMALALGGITGLGLGASRQKYLYLPAPSTDFIFPIIGEEWGLIGTLAVLGLFWVIAYQGYRIAVLAPDTFSGLLAAGITTWLVAQACINMMVATALWPITGIPLPFISYGGSALTINLAAVGILLSISRETTQSGSMLHALFSFRRRDRRPRLPRAGRRAGPARRPARA